MGFLSFEDEITEVFVHRYENAALGHCPFENDVVSGIGRRVRVTREHHVPGREATRRDDVPHTGPQGTSLSDFDSVERIPSDYRMSIRDARTNVFRFQIGIILENRVLGLTLCQKAEDELDRNSHATNDRFTSKNIGTGRNTLQQLISIHSHPTTRCPSFV